MFVFLDTETTGTEEDDRLCQIAYKIDGGKIVNEFFNPQKKIDINAMCVHHITNEMVAKKPIFRGSHIEKKLFVLLDDPENCLVAHNAKFDVDMIKKEGISPKNVICTLRLARHLDPKGEIPKY
ncbi:MAG: 3'-5' exonuclease, partial [Desulfobacteraceae bacterium]|nr:3'-5' exonuclease [Desulfobacteraceae bacterium]